jgi:aryl carrier-like protein
LLEGGAGVHLPLPCDLRRMAPGDPAWEKRVAWLTQTHFDDSPATSIVTASADAKTGVKSAVASFRPHLRELLQRELRELMGTSTEVDVDESLMDAGLDSFAATELTSRLRSLTGVDVSPTLVFEQPTARAITTHLLEISPQGEDEVQAVELIESSPKAAAADACPRAQDAVVHGIAGRWPGSCASSDVLWNMIQAGGDAIRQVPLTRWTLSAEADVAMLSNEQIAGTCHGGFVASAQRFDTHAFASSPLEGESMDPHQRLQLETGYTSLHSAGFRRATLMDAKMGVLVGISKTDFQQLAAFGKLSAAGSVYVGTGSDLGIVPRRLSYTLGLQGPAFSLHTACSSSLVALDVVHHYSGQVQEWSVGGVHMVLTPPFHAANSGGEHASGLCVCSAGQGLTVSDRFPDHRYSFAERPLICIRRARRRLCTVRGECVIDYPLSTGCVDHPWFRDKARWQKRQLDGAKWTGAEADAARGA